MKKGAKKDKSNLIWIAIIVIIIGAFVLYKFWPSNTKPLFSPSAPTTSYTCYNSYGTSVTCSVGQYCAGGSCSPYSPPPYVNVYGCYSSSGSLQSCNNSQLCYNGVCVNSVPSAATCTDSDGGLNYYTKGTVSWNSYNYNDYCYNNLTLYEYYCSNGQMNAQTYNCPNGTICSNGVCKAKNNVVEYTLKKGDVVNTNQGFKLNITNVGKINYNNIIYPLLDFDVIAGNNSYISHYSMPLPQNFTGAVKVFQPPHIYGIKPGALLIKSINSTDNSIKVSINACALISSYAAIGNKKILFVSAYTEKVKEEAKNHNLRVKNIYEPVFSDIVSYIKTKQRKFIGAELLRLNFTVSTPVIIPSEVDYYNKPDQINITLNYIRNQTSFEPSNFDLIIFWLYGNTTIEQPLQSNNNQNIFITYTILRSPEQPLDWENQDIFYSNIKPAYTGTLSHEIFHSFGMSDEIARNAGYYGAVYYIGKSFNGSQELIIPGPDNPTYKTGSDVQNEAERLLGDKFFVGQFQEINNLMAQELGWEDINNNDELDVFEVCERVCIPEYNARIDPTLAGVKPYDFCSKK